MLYITIYIVKSQGGWQTSSKGGGEGGANAPLPAIASIDILATTADGISAIFKISKVCV